MTRMPIVESVRRSAGAGARGEPRTVPRGPGEAAAARMFGVNLALGVLGLASALFLFTRVFESWRVGSGHTADVITLFGQRLSYPAANAGAIVVAVLAGVGLLVIAAAARGVARELGADRRFRRTIAREPSSSFHGAWIIDDDRPQAFCSGLLHPRVYLSRGAVQLLGAPELSAVLAHERHHARRRDPLRLASGRVLADALFFLPALRRLVERQQALAEIGADEAAVATAGGDRSALASAMLGFSGASSDEAIGLDPERIDYLLGEAPRWRFPLVLCLAVGFALAAVLGFAVLAGQTASGSATLALPFVSAKPCILMLAAIPAGVGLAGVLCVRAQPRSRRAAVRPTAARN